MARHFLLNEVFITVFTPLKLISFATVYKLILKVKRKPQDECISKLVKGKAAGWCLK